jgi:hypothetical protein
MGSLSPLTGAQCMVRPIMRRGQAGGLWGPEALRAWQNPNQFFNPPPQSRRLPPLHRVWIMPVAAESLASMCPVFGRMTALHIIGPLSDMPAYLRPLVHPHPATLKHRTSRCDRSRHIIEHSRPDTLGQISSALRPSAHSAYEHIALQGAISRVRGSCRPATAHTRCVTSTVHRCSSIEVMTGFRVALGGAQALYGVTPDLGTPGKALAAGRVPGPVNPFPLCVRLPHAHLGIGYV